MLLNSELRHKPPLMLRDWLQTVAEESIGQYPLPKGPCILRMWAGELDLACKYIKGEVNIIHPLPQNPEFSQPCRKSF